MKTFEEFQEKVMNDEEFYKEFSALVKEEKNAGAANMFEGTAKAAAKLGYDVSEDQIRTAAESINRISEEDLGKVSGGAVCACGYKNRKDRGCNW